MKLLVLPSGDASTPSTRYRVLGYLPLWQAAGWDVTLVPPQQFLASEALRLAATHDVVLVQKRLMPVPWVRSLKRANPRIFFDFDDAIWTRPGRPNSLLTRLKVGARLAAICKTAQGVAVPNKVLGARAQSLGGKVHLMPMALDLEEWQPRSNGVRSSPVVGWAGSPGNLPLLEQLKPALEQLARQHPDFRLRIYCGQKPDLGQVPQDYMPYVQGTEPAAVADFDIGLAPLVDAEYERGKSPIKLLQYLACGVVPLATGVGGAQEILAGAQAAGLPQCQVRPGGDWAQAIGYWWERTEELAAARPVARAYAAAHFDARHWGHRWLELMGEVAS